ncbi:MAG: hypothetical protein A2Y25_00840 [Candidatus Melainabacteria bacterium GWF2_37_15]|nr:MAG: hypothetical protein A2Y25_00840 [Candidatus Melainabacteria bacterium GWF2_37_15]
MQSVGMNTGMPQKNINFGAAPHKVGITLAKSKDAFTKLIRREMEINPEQARRSIESAKQQANRTINKGIKFSEDSLIIKGLTKMLNTGNADGIFNPQAVTVSRPEALKTYFKFINQATSAIREGMKSSDNSLVKEGSDKMFEAGRVFGTLTKKT